MILRIKSPQSIINVIKIWIYLKYKICEIYDSKMITESHFSLGIPRFLWDDNQTRFLYECRDIWYLQKHIRRNLLDPLPGWLRENIPEMWSDVNQWWECWLWECLHSPWYWQQQVPRPSQPPAPPSLSRHSHNQQKWKISLTGLGQVRSGQVRSGQVRSGQIRLGNLK